METVDCRSATGGGRVTRTRCPCNYTVELHPREDAVRMVRAWRAESVPARFDDWRSPRQASPRGV